MRKIPPSAGEYIAEEMRTGKYTREQAIAIGISRARAAEKTAKTTKTRKTTMAAQADRNAAEELKIFIDNDSSLYLRTTSSSRTSSPRSAKASTTSSKAVIAFMHFVEVAAKKYAKEVAGEPHRWASCSASQPASSQRGVRDDFESEAKLGKYDNFLPKKYQKR